MRDDRDERDDADEDGPPYPIVVTIAGVAWIVFGGLILVNMAVLVLLMSAAAGGPQGGGIVAVLGMLGLFSALFAAAFIFVGVQSVRGTAPGTLGNGIGSIVFGVLNFASGIQQLSQQNVLQAAIIFVFGLGLIAAGVLALIGQADYKAWRRANRLERVPRKRRRRYADDEDEDDRPRRRRRNDDDEEDEDRPRRPRAEEEDTDERIRRKPRRGGREDD